jgi:hypothetical protein
MKPTFDDVSTRFGKGGKEVSFRGTSGQRYQGPMLPTEDSLEGMPLLDTTVVRAGVLVEEEKAGPSNWVVRSERQDSDEFSPVLVTGGGQGFADSTDDDGVCPFHPNGWISANAFDSPDARWPGIGQVGLDIMIDHGRLDQGARDVGQTDQVIGNHDLARIQAKGVERIHASGTTTYEKSSPDLKVAGVLSSVISRVIGLSAANTLSMSVSNFGSKAISAFLPV